MKRKNMSLWATLIGAVVGALVVLLNRGTPMRLGDFGVSSAPIARLRMIVAAIPWVIFSLYWEIAAKSAAEAKSSESSSSRGVHLFLTNAALLLEIVQFRWFGRFLPATHGVIAAGCAMTIFGLCVAIWARRHLGRNWSGEITIKVEHELVRSGPYKGLRHPIHTGILIMYVGTAIVTGTWLALVGVALAALAYVRKIRLEEANMRVAFGPAYDAYRRESWALAPWVF
jgi:protein-S-isoprenylcysteine O-methyltransferase Ste14